MHRLQWFFRPTSLIGLALLLVAGGLALGVRARWNAARGAEHFTQGRLALKQGDNDRALTEFTEAIRLAPLSVDSRRERARLLIVQQCWEEALVDLDAALRRAPTDSELYELRARTYVGRGGHEDRPADLDLAIADADEALRLDPGQALAYCHRALARSAKFDDDKALADAEEAVRLMPNGARAFCTRGHIRTGRGEDEKAVADFSEAIRLDPKLAQAFARRGVSRFELHEDATALADCNRAVELAPRDSLVYCCRARVYRKDRRYTEELTDLDRAVAQNPRDVYSYFLRAVCHAMRHDARRAFADCAAALAINPDSSLALACRSLCHLERGRKQKALADMEQAVRLRPDYPYLRLLSAGFHQMEDEPDKALAECDQALKGGNAFIARLVYPRRATSFLQKGDVKAASADCAQALRLDPKSVEAYAIRAVADSEGGDAGRSQSDFDKALALDRGKAYLFRAELFEVLKLSNQAVADLTELIKITPEDVGPYRARARAYLGPLLQPAAMGVGTDRNTLIISKVYPNMPAAKAGVQVGDQIVRVGSLFPSSFSQVVDYLTAFQAGAALEMDIFRNGGHKVFRMVLAARPPELGNPNRAGVQPQAERALGDCQKAVQLDADDPVNHRLLALAYDLLDRHDEAIKSATEALRLDPEDPLAHLSRARSYLARKENDKAIADVNEALRLEAEGGVPYALRGLAHADQREEEKAKADLAAAARLDPNLAGLKEAYDRQLAQPKPGPPWQPQFPPVKLLPFKPPFPQPAGEPFRWPSGGAVAVVLAIGTAAFLIALLAGYRKAKARRRAP